MKSARNRAQEKFGEAIDTVEHFGIGLTIQGIDASMERIYEHFAHLLAKRKRTAPPHDSSGRAGFACVDRCKS